MTMLCKWTIEIQQETIGSPEDVEDAVEAADMLVSDAVNDIRAVFKKCGIDATVDVGYGGV